MLPVLVFAVGAALAADQPAFKPLVSIEIPSAPIGPTRAFKTPSRVMQAKTVWVSHLDNYHLLGLKFARPLSTDGRTASGRRLRKASSAM